MKFPKPRRKMIINHEVQYDMLMHVGLWICGLFVAQILTAFLFIHEVQSVAEKMSAMEFITRYRISFLFYQLIPVGLGLVFGTYFFNRFSSRIAGPLYNMKRVVKRANEHLGEPAEIKLRENDYFKKEIEDINVLLRRKY